METTSEVEKKAAAFTERVAALSKEHPLRAAIDLAATQDPDGAESYRLAGIGAEVDTASEPAPLLSLSVRRLHDQARSAWWLLALIVPILGPLLLAFLLFFKRGTDGSNQYGDDPRRIGRDYLRVAIHEPA